MPRPLPPADFYRRTEACPAEESVGYLLRRLLTEMRNQTDVRLEPHGLTNAQWEPLFKLWKSQARTVAELAQPASVSTRVEASATTSTVSVGSVARAGAVRMEDLLEVFMMFRNLLWLLLLRQ